MHIRMMWRETPVGRLFCDDEWVVVSGATATLESSDRYRHGSGYSLTEALRPMDSKSRPRAAEST